MLLKEKAPIGWEEAMVTNSPITSCNLILRKEKALVNYCSKPHIHLEFGNMISFSIFVHGNTPVLFMIIV